MLSQTTIPLTVDSFPTGASVYVDGILIGKAPITKKVSRGGTHKIRCTLSGYNDYTYDYVVAPFNSAVNAVKGDWRCLLAIRMDKLLPLFLLPILNNRHSKYYPIPHNHCYRRKIRCHHLLPKSYRPRNQKDFSPDFGKESSSFLVKGRRQCERLQDFKYTNLKT